MIKLLLYFCRLFGLQQSADFCEVTPEGRCVGCKQLWTACTCDPPNGLGNCTPATPPQFGFSLLVLPPAMGSLMPGEVLMAAEPPPMALMMTRDWSVKPEFFKTSDQYSEECFSPGCPCHEDYAKLRQTLFEGFEVSTAGADGRARQFSESEQFRLGCCWYAASVTSCSD